jgi:hypothetical protein
MKKYFLLLLLAAGLLQSCSSSKKTTAKSGDSTSIFKKGSSDPAKIVSGPEADGSSFEKAIVITAGSETIGIRGEYEYLDKTYPNYKRGSQSLYNKNGKAYDMLHITLADGTSKDVYFDITDFFGKY